MISFASGQPKSSLCTCTVAVIYIDCISLFEIVIKRCSAMSVMISSAYGEKVSISLEI